MESIKKAVYFIIVLIGLPIAMFFYGIVMALMGLFQKEHPIYQNFLKYIKWVSEYDIDKDLQ